MTKELLEQIANMELRDQLEAKEQMIKELKEKLEIAIQFLGLLDKRRCHMTNCQRDCPLHKYYEKDKGCATCCSNACHDALKKMGVLK